MNRCIYLVFLCVFFAGCNLSEEVEAIEANDNSKRIWIFAQFNVPEEKDALETYFYFGEVPEKLYQKISTNRIKSGFILLENVRYWGKDDKIYELRGKGYSGDVLFRIEDIRKLERVVTEPKVGGDLESVNQPKPEEKVEKQDTSKQETKK